MDDSAQPPTGAKQTTMKTPAKMRRKEMNVLKLARVAGPEEFVRFTTPEHVEFNCAFLQCGANRQCHQYQTDAVLLIRIVEPVLVKIKRAVIKKAVHDGG